MSDYCNASPHIVVMDSTITPAVTLPIQPGIPNNYYIVVDSLTASITAGAAGSYGLTVAGEDTVAIYSLLKFFGAGETDVLHVSFPKGLVVWKSSQDFGSIFQGTRSNIAYSSGATITVIGVPTAGRATMSYRYVSPADVGW